MARDSTEDFFEEATESSRIKAQMIAEYFSGWAKIVCAMSKPWQLTGERRYGYLDLYSGPGVYKDGTYSTPLLIIERMLAVDELRKHTISHFNDGRDDRINRLSSEIDQRLASLEEAKRLAHRPSVSNYVMGSQFADVFGQFAKIPTVCFIDPFGVKGLTLDLVAKFMRGRGSDCIFFFNYSKVNWHIDAEHYAPHVDALFGHTRAERLRALLRERNHSPHQREQHILAMLQEALSGIGAIKVAPFKFLDGDGSKTSHFLFLATKSGKAEEIWKSIAKRKSTYTDQGIPLFIFSPKIDKARDEKSQPLFDLGVGAVDGLKRQIVTRFAGQEVSVEEVVAAFTRGTTVMPQNIKQALIELHDTRKITLSEHRQSKARIQLGNDVKVNFPLG